MMTRKARARSRTDEAREKRITWKIIVDAYTPSEQAMGWYCYLDEALRSPFTARCVAERAISPLKKGDEVEVIGMAPEEECEHEMFVMIRWERHGLAVPLSQLEALHVDGKTRQAIEDWYYWVKQGYDL
jgi:hypothetical protein